ncbi:hypothetical protein VD0002_g6319 [Verticillium dahliae]|uniref:C2 domain-containing protein n=1 Tax=Verticillium dahliae TaxID=27337 RepID=A0AA45AK24_VERDA|nr:ATP-binding cassette transporter abc4 [Verticillium dahliae VDG2]KAH6709872.1 hypothetical protein EV126DRAFT_5092 [Verticillium dahliae]PNH29630.1 hypothetical protein BJF96_g7110 [Verticillium dahliae]PNH49586.1 hypothetical protein VD0003_g7548 [Verticillium dahliae]PNH61513.1 hypothetical protein VD0002_g6319 [Verticillium dahliae]
MASKSKSHPLNGMHTAGIFSDLSADGPLIGTLVAIVDRAKNLPNRKTIGKQDPYCAARLGKEAKKTTTDIRGGQTPKWDQELRFAVHDSPDYYQLKVSVFNDDKKTDLIGETWIDLRDIIVQGGGQNDLWHNLTCKGKYAGEVRMEITYYDTRPKPEKPVGKAKPVTSDPQDAPKSSSRSPVKRRPLPSDPFTGEAPIGAASHPEPVATPPRALPRQPSSYIPNQSPLQNVEYNTPPPAPRHHQGDPYAVSPLQSLPHTPTSAGRYESYSSRHDDREYSPRHQSHPSQDRREPRAQPNGRRESYDVFAAEDARQDFPDDDDRPPPPPVHRSRHNSGVSAQDAMIRPAYETPPKTTPLMRHDVLKHEAHRRSAPSYPGRPAFRAYDSAPAANNLLQNTPEEPSHHPSPPRHHSYDTTYEPYRSMQPTVEDAPESPSQSVGSAHQVVSRRSIHDDMGYDQVPSPAPLNLSGRGSAARGQRDPSPQPSHSRQDDYGDYGRQQPLPVSPISSREYTHSPGDVSHPSHSSQSQYPLHRNELSGTEIQAYGMPSVPSSLVPGVDPLLAQEVSDRIHDERRHERRYTQSAATPPRGRQQSQQQIEPSNYEYMNSQNSYSAPSYDSQSIVPYQGNSPAQQGQMVRARRSISPMPNHNHTIKRKSVSPAPPPSDEPEGRRLSGVPFGPDSYDLLNPSLSGGKETLANPDAKIITHDGREIDPSDHLPMDTWAPEPEPKQAPPLAPSGRARPGGAQPMPPTGRRPLRIAGRPHSQSAAPAPTYPLPDDPPVTPQSGGRNRLQKRTHRASALPAPPPVGSSPLAPISSHNHQESLGGGFTPPTRLPRASTWDYPSENHAPQYGSSPGGSRGAPPVPDKIPLPLMSGALTHRSSGGGGGGEDWALMHEMSQIDIGAGRSRRHGGY